jgi:hypothetical protein
MDVEIDRRTNFAEGNSHLSLYCFHGKLQDFSHFPVFEFIFLDQLEDQAASCGQLVDGLPYALDHFSGDHQLLGIKINAFKFGGQFTQVLGSMFVLAGAVIKGRILGGDIKVNFKIGDGFEPSAFFPYMDKYILNRLFGLLFGRKKGTGKLQQEVIETHEQLFIGLLVIITGNSPL